MATFFADFLPMMVAQALGLGQVPRIPEPSGVMAGEENVVEYNEAMATKFAVAYAAGLEIVHRVMEKVSGGSAMDLACGPGHNTMCFAKYLGFDEVLGTDLSECMVRAATENAHREGLAGKIRFEVRDAVQPDESTAGKWDLVTFCHAAHHMPTIDMLAQVLRCMDHYAKRDGLVMVMDLVRLRTAKLNDRFVNVLGHDYLERGLQHYFKDFQNSMLASWTPAEMVSAVPRETRRWWCHLLPRGLPTTQILLGLPVGRKQVFVRSGWGVAGHPLFREWYSRWERQVSPAWAKETLHDAKLLWMTLFRGSKRMFPPSDSL